VSPATTVGDLCRFSGKTSRATNRRVRNERHEAEIQRATGNLEFALEKAKERQFPPAAVPTYSA
jgi:enamine deaminase RidA (YjgF/YER057c/UK114 family)